MITHIIDVLRVRQWYKNIVIFLALFFSGNMFSTELVIPSILGFIALCLLSSTNYIINDIHDYKSDTLNPEKKSRAIASGRISKVTAISIAILLLSFSVILSMHLGNMFLYTLLAIFVLTQCYTFYLKKVILADVLAIATLFVLRSISGAFLINVKISPWLVLCPFFFSFFFSVGKRQSELHLLKEHATKTRKVLHEYTKEFTNSLMILATTLLVISYSLYSFLSPYNRLLYTLPFALYVIFRFYYLISSGSLIARHPEKVIKDFPMVIGILLWLIVTVVLIYT